MPYCETSTLVKHSPARTTIRPLKCKRWTCPRCVEDRQRRLIREAMGGSPNKFLTLTMRPLEGASADRMALELANCWRKLRRQLMKTHGLKRLPFMAVFERHGSGMPHLHIALRSGWIEIDEVIDYMWEHHRSHKQDIRAVDNPAKIGGYVAKYMAKEPEKFRWSKRYWKSRDYELDHRWKKKPERPPGWWNQVFHNGLIAVIDMYRRKGWRPVRLKPKLWCCYHDRQDE